MNDIAPCGHSELLVTCLYDECEPAERESIAAHVAICASCAEELQALRATRVHLAAWSPPALPLGFQITRTEAEAPAKVLRPAGRASRSSQSEGWWRQPLPAWAQVAAAAVIFAAGISLGAGRSAETPAIPAAASSAAATVSTPLVADAVSRDDLARLDARVRSVESAQAQQASLRLQRTAAGSIDEHALLTRVTALVDARVAQSERQNIQMLATFGRALEDYRTELDGRLDFIEEEQQDARQAISRGLGQSSLIRAASLR